MAPTRSVFWRATQFHQNEHTPSLVLKANTPCSLLSSDIYFYLCRTEIVNEIDAFVLTIQYLLKNKRLEDFCVPFDQTVGFSFSKGAHSEIDSTKTYVTK